MDVSLIQVPYMMGDERQGKGPQRLVQAGAEKVVAAKGVAVTVERVDRDVPFRDSGNASLAVNKRLASTVRQAVDARRLPFVLAGGCDASTGVLAGFEHNQCGSETTMETPFDVWLNEAFTVDVERQFMAQVFDPAVVRLNQVESIRSPLLGPLSIEDSGHAGRIVREGFNDPDELIDGVTYVKAAEVIRMLRLLLGDERFKAGKTLSEKVK